MPVGSDVIKTRYRTIISEIPHPGSLALIEELGSIEPRSMHGFGPVVWDHAEGFQVYDGFGNKWIDFTSSVVLTNAGHSNGRIGEMIRRQLSTHLWHAYCNPSQTRLDTLKALKGILPEYLDKILLLSTGSEAVECAIKLARMYGQTISKNKFRILSYYNSFHGRTMAAQSAGGFGDQQEWMVKKPEGFHHIPFPECWRCPWGKPRYDNCGHECWTRTLQQLKEQGIAEDEISAVVTETFQGPTVAFMPNDYVLAVRQWALEHRVLLIFDEIQAGFGRTGRWFGFEHYGIECDLVCLGKGISSSLPMSAVAGRAGIMDLPSHGHMSSTHSGNPLCCAATLGNIQAIKEQRLLENCASLGHVISDRLRRLWNSFPGRIASVNGKGLVWAICLVDPCTGALDVRLAEQITTRCMQLGLLMLQTGRGTLKIAPPLCINEEAVLEGIDVITQAMNECVKVSCDG